MILKESYTWDLHRINNNKKWHRENVSFMFITVNFVQMKKNWSLIEKLKISLIFLLHAILSCKLLACLYYNFDIALSFLRL